MKTLLIIAFMSLFSVCQAQTVKTCQVLGKIGGTIQVLISNSSITSITFVHPITTALGRLGIETETLYGPGIRGVKLDTLDCAPGAVSSYNADKQIMRVSSNCKISAQKADRVYFDATLNSMSDGTIHIHVTGNDQYRLIDTGACK